VTKGDNATLVERVDLDPTLAIFRIRPDAVPAEGMPWFLAGQYVTIGIGEIQRAYSIASEPSDRRWLEFYIRYARDPETDTPLTHRLWELKAGARLQIGEKIAGRFTLERTAPAGNARVKLLVAAGTGLAPFVSMVRRARRGDGPVPPAGLVVLHGVSHPHELAYRDELAGGSGASAVGYVPTVSRPAAHPEWTGLTGRVESLFDDGRIPGVELRPEKTAVYVCGFKDTIAGAVRRLLRHGFMPEDRRMRRLVGIPAEAQASLFFEQYDLEPIFDANDAELIAAMRKDVEAGGSA
jgi:ferredoxin--NADP+ reductase